MGLAIKSVSASSVLQRPSWEVYLSTVYPVLLVGEPIGLVDLFRRSSGVYNHSWDLDLAFNARDHASLDARSGEGQRLLV